MKRTAFVILAAMAMAGCYDSRDVDLSFETADCNIHMGTNRTVVYGDDAWGDYSIKDTIRYDGTVVEMMSYLLWSQNTGDSLTIVSYDHQKQSYLPDYHFLITHKPGAGEWKENLQQVIDELQRQQLVRLDTAVVPAERLVVSDMALLKTWQDSARANYLTISFSLGDAARELREHGLAAVLNASGIVEPVMPIGEDTLACTVECGPNYPANDSTAILDYRAYHDLTWNCRSRKTLEACLAEYGLAIVPDPQGRQVTHITVNRCKGKY